MRQESRESTLKKIEQEKSEALAKANREWDLLEALASAGVDVNRWKIFVYQQRDEVWLTFQFNRYSSLDQDKHQPDRELVQQLWTIIPPTPAALFRDGSVSIYRLAEAEAKQQVARDRMAEGQQSSSVLTPVQPIWYRVSNTSHKQEIQLEWRGTFAGQPVRVAVEFSPWQTKLGQVSVNYERYRDGEIKSCLGWSLDGAPAGSRHIRYGSGDHKTPGEPVVYWELTTEVDVQQVIAAGLPTREAMESARRPR